MADQYVQVAADSTGKKVDTSELTVNSQTVQRQRVIVGSNSDDDAFGSVFPAGFLRVTDEPTQLFYDPFESLDVTDRWNAAVSGGGGVAAAVSIGRLTLGSGTTANGYSTIGSRPTFIPPIPGWLGASFAISHEWPVTANTYRFWGIGAKTGTPSASAPLTNAVGFELATDGKLYAVVYSAGVRTAVQDLSAATGNSKQPTDSSGHRYIVMYRTDRTYWYIDSLDNPAATSSFGSPEVQVLPVHMASIAGAVAPASSGVLTVHGLAVWDTGKNNFGISDGTFPWRKAGVTVKGTQGTNALAVQRLHDAGRNQSNLFMATLTLSGTAEAMVSLTGYKSVAAVGATATPAVVTAGKTWRLTSIILEHKAINTMTGVEFRIRANLSGAGVVTSPLVMVFTIGPSIATAGVQQPPTVVTLGEGLDFAAGTGVAVGMIGISTTGVPGTAGGYGRISLLGFEY
jgi:hypothetical protein